MQSSKSAFLMSVHIVVYIMLLLIAVTYNRVTEVVWWERVSVIGISSRKICADDNVK